VNSSTTDVVTVKILGREFRLRCQPEERDGLIAASHYLDQEMRSIRDVGTIIGMERIAIMAALNIAHKLIQTKASQEDMQSRLTQRLLQINETVVSTLAASEKADID